jgi:hypothetical protein
MVVSEGDRSLIAPGTKSTRCTACTDNLFAGKEAGGGCYDANESEGAGAAAVRCRCQRRRAASRRLLLLGELGGR